MQRLSSAILTLLFGSAAFAMECPDILVTVADDQSPFTLSCFGRDVCDISQFDRLAAFDIVLDQAGHMGSMSGAVCPSSRTMIMSVSTLLSPWGEKHPESEEGKTDLTLKEAVGGRFDIGVGLGWKAIQEPENQSLLLNHFNYVTAENCMKFAAIQPAEGKFQFEQADQFVQFARDNNLKVLGHCLVWAKDDRTPEWFYREGGQQVRPEVLMRRMKTHVKTVVERYTGRVQSWDVVNEAIGDRGDEYLRDSVWAKLLNDDFIVEAFRYTHELDPGALLIYNDYHLHERWRRDRMERLIRKLRGEGAHIDAIGIQGHYNLDDVPYEQLEELLTLLRKLKLKIAISELDIDMIPRNGWWANGGRDREQLKQYNPYPEACPSDLLARQAEQYGRLFDLFQKYEDVILRVTFWNLHDGESWLNDFPWKRTNYPLLFDRSRQPKPAFHAVIESLSH